jgi:hypothetical protein
MRDPGPALIMTTKHLFSLAILAALGAFVGVHDGRGADVSIEVKGGDYYGRDYGRPVPYGHPAYREDYRLASPPDRRRVEERRAPERHDAPPAKERDERRDGREATTPEPRNQHP